MIVNELKVTNIPKNTYYRSNKCIDLLHLLFTITGTPKMNTWTLHSNTFDRNYKRLIPKLFSSQITLIFRDLVSKSKSKFRWRNALKRAFVLYSICVIHRRDRIFYTVHTQTQEIQGVIKHFIVIQIKN